ncbi:Putative fatty acyl-CoA reductase [Apis cerana cerana]|uniref:Fatty acyl-CoA reductase n=1 Tax=Apis cerana cerana TaxID=94128 RepID=A0A2A3EMS1_APICC|nr:Putative fatty acyl-CoA reductase [Apis cerana cerana]
MSELTEIQSFYKGKNIFVTGGTGLMGKVLIEKLLYSCTDINKIYVLIRPKRGRTPEIRMDEMLKLPMFQRIRKQKPQMMKKVVTLNGDVSVENLGLSKEQSEILMNEIDIVFHFAATLKLEAKLKDAIEMNTIGTKRILELAKKMKKLKTFVHLSTAFCYADKEELDEKVYDPSTDPHDVMKMVEWLDESAIDLITPKLLNLHPNTYTYSKRLAEKLVADEYPNLPCSIARPSIVTPALAEPLPGWVDNLNGPVGIMVGAGKGVIRSMLCNGNYHAEMIPVDFAINSLIAIAHKTATNEKNTSIPVYNITQSGVVPITWGEILGKGKKIAYQYPFEGQIWYPDGDIQVIMVRIQNRISIGLELLQYFTTREWVFHNTNLLILWGEMNPKDKEIFPIDLLSIDDNEYIKTCVLGARQYCMKENLSTLPKARRHQTIFGLDTVTEHMKSLPILNKVMQKFDH